MSAEAEGQLSSIHRHVFSRAVEGHDEEWFVPVVVQDVDVRGVLVTPMNRVAPAARTHVLPVPIPEEWEWHEIEAT